MELIYNHIQKYLLNFLYLADTSIDEIVYSIKSDALKKNIQLLLYIDSLLNSILSEENSTNVTLHLHIEDPLDEDSLLVIAQYLLIRFFNDSCTASSLSSQKEENIGQIKARLGRRLNRPCPEGASRKNGGNRIYNNWIRNKKNTQSLIDFYDKLGTGIEISENSIFNTQVGFANSLSDIYATRPYARKIEEYGSVPTFNLLNTKLTLNEIDEKDTSIIDNLKTVILFDCDRKKLMQYFSLQEIEELEINLKNYLILTFGSKKNSIQSLRDKLTLIQERFKVPKSQSYPIIQSEIDYLNRYKTKHHIPIKFYGPETWITWDNFVLETKIMDLYELRSIKMMNLYSLCFNDEIKNFIIEDIFSDKDSSILVSDETKESLSNLREEDLEALKVSLDSIFNLIINCEIRQTISERIKNETILVVDNVLINSKKLKSLVVSSLSLTEKNKLITWSDLNTFEKGDVLILSYQDQGRYPYYFYPNLIETTVSKNLKTTALFHKLFFYHKCQWAKYNLAKDLYKLTDHAIRQKYLHWGKLHDHINGIRPEKNNDINWILEQQYSGNTFRETFKLKLKNEKERTFDSSELFIYSMDKSSFRVSKIEELIEVVDEEEKYFVHHLDEIQQSINLYEKMIDTSQQEEELQILRQQFQLVDTETGRLWKVLLKDKSSKTNEYNLYNVLKNHFEKSGLKIVSFNHFKKNWLDPESESIAPLNKKVFIELCQFLKLPRAYYILIQRLKNTAKQSSRQSTQQMNRLLQNLFNDGCFDNGVDIHENIKSNLVRYKNKHPLDELGIDEKYLGDNLIALIELIKSEVTLKEVEKFKKVE